jgi:hypothetical protein
MEKPVGLPACPAWLACPAAVLPAPVAAVTSPCPVLADAETDEGLVGLSVQAAHVTANASEARVR